MFWYIIGGVVALILAIVAVKFLSEEAPALIKLFLSSCAIVIAISLVYFIFKFTWLVWSIKIVGAVAILFLLFSVIVNIYKRIF